MMDGMLGTEHGPDQSRFNALWRCAAVDLLQERGI